MTTHIAMWSGPRNLSTAMMYSFAARGDCAVWDEPFYAAYLQATGIPHPMAAEVIAAGEPDPSKVAAICTGHILQCQSLFYQKHMTLHMIPAFGRRFMRGLTNVFLIRHPAHVIASYAQKRDAPTLADIGFAQQAELFDEVADWLGKAPLVVNCADIRTNPECVLARLCAALGIAYTPKMLSWPAGPKLYDGVWAPHWYNAVWASTGFGAAPDEPPPLPPDLQSIADEARPYYEKLKAHKL
jgi:hypothetical protein